MSEPTAKPIGSPPHPGLPFHSLTFLTLVIQGLYFLIAVLLVVGVSQSFLMRRQVAEANRWQAILKTPPAGTTPQDQQSAHFKLKELVPKLQQTEGICSAVTVALVLFSSVLALAWVGWVHKATSNLPALGVEPKYSVFISSVGMLLIPLFVGLPILNEIAKGSDPDRLTPYGHRSEGISLLVVAWWLATLFGNFAWICVTLIVAISAEPDLHPPAGWIVLLALGLGVLPCALGAWLVGSVQSQQLARLPLATNRAERPTVAVVPEYTG